MDTLSADICFRRAETFDVDEIYRWANDPITRQQSFDSKPIEYEEHVNWFQKKIVSPNCIFLVAEAITEDKTQPALVGSVRLEREMDLEINPNVALGESDVPKFVISYQVNPDFRGRGFGSEMIEMISNPDIIKPYFSKMIYKDDFFLNNTNVKEIILIGEVKADNTASIRCFEKNGFKEEPLGDKYNFTRQVFLV